MGGYREDGCSAETVHEALQSEGTEGCYAVFERGRRGKAHALFKRAVFRQVDADRAQKLRFFSGGIECDKDGHADLREHRGCSRAGYAKGQNGNKQNIKRDIGRGGEQYGVKRGLCIPDGTQQRCIQVVAGEERYAEQDDAQIGERVGEDLCRGIHQREHRGEEEGCGKRDQRIPCGQQRKEGGKNVAHTAAAARADALSCHNGKAEREAEHGV